ncbi:hypothetical protein CPA40_00110 [Bifidobacterium callitrichos]|uniref:Lipoprotein n=1 Tax=Bifidobacterium callitrichos TaxID=762209 RepID=A0A2T3GCT3_9BIFI|nr:DUF6350 family protein [Bifidobacterium callitrichos]PST47279.1 hypothetical protein CPA40_00110 [Bifidobacterium callitrichos]
MKLKSRYLAIVIKGAVASLGAMALYAISLGCFIALMLLVISMEEGGENLPTSAVPLTQAVILLSQGVGFSLGTVRVGITPLLLTILLVALIAQCARKAGGNIINWAVGLGVWIVLDLMCANGTSIELEDPPLTIIAKAAAIWTVGYLLGALPGSRIMSDARTAFRERVGARAYDAVALALLLVTVMFIVACVAGLVVVIVWITRDWQGMALLFDMDGMENGSRILTTIASCAWLPNLMVWAFSWLLGAGFHIGDLGVFTMWAGQSAGLPPLPVFGLMPEGVDDDRIRLILQCVIPAIYAVLALLAMLLPGPMKVRPVAFGDADGLKRLIITMLCHAGVLVAVAATTIGLSAAGFALSNGPLGHQRLAHVGVDVVPSTAAVARALGFGLTSAWLVITVVLAAVYGIHWIVEHHTDHSPRTEHAERTSDGDPGRVQPVRAADERRAVRVAEGKAGKTPKAGRVVRSAQNVKREQPSKEEHDDNNQSSDQEGTGLRLP